MRQKKMTHQIFLCVMLNYCFSKRFGKNVFKSLHWLEIYIISRNSTKAVYNEASSKKLHGIIKDVPVDLSNQLFEEDLGNGNELKRYQRNKRFPPFLELLFKSEAKYNIVINGGRTIPNVKIKMEVKIDKIKLIQCLNCQSWGNDFSKKRKFQPVCAICGTTIFRIVIMVTFVKTPLTVVANVYHLIMCPA